MGVGATYCSAQWAAVSTLDARALAIATLAEAFKVTDLTQARVRIYNKALQKVPAAVLEPMVQRAIATRTPRWGDLPSVAELLADAETCRLTMLAGLKFEVCAVNEGCSQQGWAARDIDGVIRAVKCPCRVRHEQTVAALGVGAQPLALPAVEPLQVRSWMSE